VLKAFRVVQALEGLQALGGSKALPGVTVERVKREAPAQQVEALR